MNRTEMEHILASCEFFKILMSSAACQKPTTILAVKGADLRQMMIGNTELGFNIMERLCFLLRDRLQATYGAMEKI